MKYSNKTIAELCRALAAVVNTNAELANLFLEFGLSYNQFGGGIQPHSNAWSVLYASSQILTMP